MKAKKSAPILESVRDGEELVVEKGTQKRGRLMVSALTLLLIVSLGAIFLYRQVHILEQNLKEDVATRITELTNTLGTLIALPEGELPIIATISDPALLAAGNPFFTPAKVGDLFFYYPSARRAYLYDPQAHIVIAVARVGIGQ